MSSPFRASGHEDRLAEELLERADVSAARHQLIDADARTLDEQVELTEIAAPPFLEAARAARMAEMMGEAGLAAVATDAVGNTLGWLPGPANDAPPIVLSAHLDTVFPEGTDVRVRRSGRHLHGPGIGDDGRGLTGLLAVARALVDHSVIVQNPVLFAATVGEEGLGDLRGVRHLCGREGAGAKALGFISLDGGGLHIVHRAVGSRRFRACVEGPGGHSWADWGTPNPLHALGEVIGNFNALSLATGSTVSVGRLEGGTSVNAIPQSAWMEFEIRSEDESALQDLDERVVAALNSAIERTNRDRRPGTEPLTLALERIGNRPGGRTDMDHQLVRAALAATRALGHHALLAASSTDANLPMSVGIPAVTLGAGGEIGQAHTTDEWYLNRNGPDGLVRALLTVVVLDRLENAPAG